MSETFKYKRLLYDKLPAILLLIVILLPTFAVYSRLAGHDFVTLDDSLYVYDNPRVQSGINLDNVRWAFQTLAAEFWHPLTWLSYMLDTQIYGSGPGGYLLTNLLLHLLNSALIFIFLRHCTNRLWESWLIALVFALHPLHVEPTAWVSGRKELLCACFWLLSMMAYVEYTRCPGWRRYFPVMIFFVLGMMAKSMIVTLPFVLLLLDYWPLNRDGARGPAVAVRKDPTRRWRRLVMEKVPLFAISAGGIIITLIAQQRGGGLVSTAALPLLSRVPYIVTAYALYLKKSIWPVSLTPLYPLPAVIGAGMVIVAVLVLLTITAMVIYGARRQPYLVTGWFWFLGMLVPVIGIVKVGDFYIADRYMYMPLAGILIMVVFSLKFLIDKLSHRLAWTIIVPVLISGAYVPATSFQIQIWRNSETLYTYTVSVTRDNFLAHHALGHILSLRRDMAGAIDHFAKAVAIRPDKAVLWVALGKALACDHQWSKAEDAFSRAARLEPEHAAVWFYLGCTRAVRGETSEALAFLIKSLEKARQQDGRINSLYSKVMDIYEKGLYYESQRQPAIAGEYYQQALALIDVNESRQQVTRLLVSGYDHWMAGMATPGRGDD